MKALIFSTESIVRKQIQLKKAMFPGSVSIIVQEKFDILQWMKAYPEAIMIFDEAEQVFEKHALDVKYSGPAGLAAARE